MRLFMLVLLVVVSGVSLAGAQEAKPAADSAESDELARGESLLAKIEARVEELAAESPHALFTQHLRSTEALARVDWARAKLTAESDPKYLNRTITYLQKILDGLNGDAGKWDSYAAGRRAMVFAFVSEYDQSVQQFHLALPRDWNPDTAYPMVIYLHGHVPNIHPLWYTALPFAPNKKPNADAKKPKEDGEKKHIELPPHFVLSPWGRGNTSYRGAGEKDVWEALDIVRSQFKTDPDRLYLTGHSMGGKGTWGIGLRTPDLWAGLAIFAGFDANAPVGTGLAANAAYLPVSIWHGEKDATIPFQSAYAMRDALLKYGGTVRTVIDPEGTHMSYWPAVPVAKQWLFQYKRQRPDTFSFTADTAAHTGVWGIRMKRDTQKNPSPTFKCTIDGATVTIDSEGTDGLDVNLGEGGLGLSGKVVVVWNGKTVYEGPAKAIKLGSEAG